MERIEIEAMWIKRGALLSFIVNITILSLTFFLTPDNVQSYISSDGILEISTLAKVRTFRIIMGGIGILGLIITAYFFLNPGGANAFVEKFNIRENWLTILIGSFLIISLMIAIVPTMKSISSWQKMIRNQNAHELRMRFHPWYRRQYMIWNFVKEYIAPNELILVKTYNCPTSFFGYYLMPRPIYEYSEALVDELKGRDKKYNIINMDCSQDRENTAWSIESVNSVVIYSSHTNVK